MEEWKRNLYLVWIAETVTILGFSFVMPFLPYFIQDLGVTDMKQAAFWAGVLATTTPLMLVVSAPFWGVLADRFGRKIMLERAMFAGCVVLMLMSCVRNVQQLLILRLLQGIFTGTIVSAMALAASTAPAQYSGYALGLLQTAVYAGASAGPFLGGLASDRWGYRNSFLASSVLLAAAGLMVLLGVTENFVPPERAPKDPDKRYPRGLPAGLLLILVLLFVFQLSGTIVTPILPLFIQRLAVSSRHLASTAGFILAVSGVAAVVSAVAAGKHGDARGHERLLVPLILLAGVFCVLQAVARTTGQLLAVRVGYGLAAGGVIPLVNSIINLNTGRENVGRNFGIAGSMSALGAGLGPIIGGAAASFFTLTTPFFLGGTMLFLCGGLFLLAKKTVFSGVGTATDIALELEQAES